MRQFPLIIGAALVAFLLLMGSVFTVDQHQTAIVLRFGDVARTSIEPGLRFKVPLIDNVRLFDRRVQTLTTDNEAYLTNEQQNVLVDYFVAWKINDVDRYYRSTQGGDERLAVERLNPIVQNALRNLVNRNTLRELAEAGRSEVTGSLLSPINEGAKNVGVEVVDVRIKRLDLPDDGTAGNESVLDRVFSRMRADRNEVATRTRAEGTEAAEKIKADADREAQVTRANAERDAQKLRGAGDAKAAEIYAQAYGSDTEFYAFYRSLEAYRNALADGKTTLVLDPDSEFFQYFDQERR